MLAHDTSLLGQTIIQRLVRPPHIVYLHAQPVRHISASSFRGPHNADNVAALHPIVARHRIIELYPGQLRIPHLVPVIRICQSSICLMRSSWTHRSLEVEA